MTNKKLTYDEVMKVLLCCITSDCAGCPLKRPYCSELVALEYIRDFINRKQEEKKNLEIELKAMRGAANSYKAEIERLQSHIQEGIDLAKQIPEMLALTKAEAYKEFANNIERAFSKTESQMPNSEVIKQTVQICRNAIRIALNELVGESNG